MIPHSDSFHWTGIRGNFEKIDDDMQEDNKDIIRSIEDVFGGDSAIITGAFENVAKDIFITEKSVSEIDMSLIITEDRMLLRFIYDGEVYNPFNSEKLLKSDNIETLIQSDYYSSFDYYSMFDMNFAYIKIVSH